MKKEYNGRVYYQYRNINDLNDFSSVEYETFSEAEKSRPNYPSYFAIYKVTVIKETVGSIVLKYSTNYQFVFSGKEDEKNADM